MRMPTELRPTLDHLGEPSVGGTDSVQVTAQGHGYPG